MTEVPAHLDIEDGENSAERRSLLEAALDRLAKQRASEATPDELLAWAINGRVVQFDNAMEDLRDSADSDARRRSNNEFRPARLREAASGLSSSVRSMAERLVDDYREAAKHNLDEFISDLGMDRVPPPEKAYPPPLELGAAGLMLLYGPVKLRTESEALISQLAELGDDAASYGLAYYAWVGSRDQPSPLLAATVPAAVAQFESLLGALVHIGLALYPEAMRVTQRQFSVAEYESAGGALGARIMATDKIVTEYLRLGVTEWQTKLAQWPGIELDELTPHLPAIVEYFLRRNLIVHKNGRVDDDYLKSLPASLPVPHRGQSLLPDHEYTLCAVDDLNLLGQALATVWLPSLRPKAELDEMLATQQVYRALERQRWSTAQTLAEHYMPRVQGRDSREILRVNRWLAIREQAGSVEAVASEVSIWEPPDDDVEWKVARAALLLDETATATALRSARNSGVAIARYAKWPLLKILMARHPRLRAILAQGPRSAIEPRPRRKR
jgi:hypothetical protein